jgi:hypothetical protein
VRDSDDFDHERIVEDPRWCSPTQTTPRSTMYIEVLGIHWVSEEAP